MIKKIIETIKKLISLKSSRQNNNFVERRKMDRRKKNSDRRWMSKLTNGDKFFIEERRKGERRLGERRKG